MLTRNPAMPAAGQNSHGVKPCTKRFLVSFRAPSVYPELVEGSPHVAKITAQHNPPTPDSSLPSNTNRPAPPALNPNPPTQKSLTLKTPAARLSPRPRTVLFQPSLTGVPPCPHPLRSSPTRCAPRPSALRANRQLWKLKRGPSPASPKPSATPIPLIPTRPPPAILPPAPWSLPQPSCAPCAPSRPNLPFDIPFERVLDGGSAWEYFQPVRAGDTITAAATITDIVERTGRLGLMLILTTRITYSNQFGEIVATQTNTSIRY